MYYNLEDEIETGHSSQKNDNDDDSHSSEDEKDDKDEDDENENEESGNESSTVKPTSLQQKMVALSGQNVDEFMKEMEKMDDTTKPKQPTAAATTVPTALAATITPTVAPSIAPVVVEPIAPPGVELQIQKPILIRAPPGPPPGRPLFAPPAFRMPTAPAHRMLRLPGPPTAPPCLPVLTAAPQLIAPKQQGATISAKPQIRNLSADVTRFVPSTLRVKREEKKVKNTAKTAAALVHELRQKDQMLKIGTNQPSKDDAYMQFMKEMQGLL